MDARQRLVLLHISTCPCVASFQFGPGLWCLEQGPLHPHMHSRIRLLSFESLDGSKFLVPSFGCLANVAQKHVFWLRLPVRLWFDWQSMFGCFFPWFHCRVLFLCSSLTFFISTLCTNSMQCGAHPLCQLAWRTIIVFEKVLP